jgi:acetyl-CoA acetyltransferase
LICTCTLGLASRFRYHIGFLSLPPRDAATTTRSRSRRKYSGLTRYDHFTPFTLIQLEELGFCGQGEAKDFIADGAIEIGGRLPINTHGGQLGEAYIHGMNGIAEGVRQLRGTSLNQVTDVEHVLVTAGTGVPTSGLILG